MKGKILILDDQADYRGLQRFDFSLATVGLFARNSRLYLCGQLTLNN